MPQTPRNELPAIGSYPVAVEQMLLLAEGHPDGNTNTCEPDVTLNVLARPKLKSESNSHESCQFFSVNIKLMYIALHLHYRFSSRMTLTFGNGVTLASESQGGSV